MDIQRSSQNRIDRLANSGRSPPGPTISLGPGARHPAIRPSTTSDHAFSLIALRCLETLAANQEATARGESAALHQMRIAVTCLKAAVSFFSPMVAGDQWERLKLEFKWLNSHLGAARDLDVVIGQFAANGDDDTLTPGLRRDWSASHVRVAAALKSERFRRLLAGTAEWVQRGDWREPAVAAPQSIRAMTISDYACRRLTRWRAQILRRSGELAAMDPETRHRLRIRTKRLRYATEWFGEYLPGSTPKVLRATLKQLRRAQDSLGELNDAERARVLLESSGAAATLPSTQKSSMQKRDKQLIRTTQAAFAALTALSQEG